MSKKINKILLAFGFLVLLNTISTYFYYRFDITADKRFTLSKISKKIISKISEPLFITVYLEGDFPSEFKRLQVETKQFLEELAAENNQIIINFENPDNQRETLIKRGMLPSKLTVEEDGKLSEAIIFPWAEISYKEKSVLVSLLPTAIAASQEEQLKKAIENLEYSFSNAIYVSTQKRQKKIAVISGNGELQDIYLYSFLSELTKKYKLAKFTLDSVANKPKQTLKELIKYDLAIFSKPTQKFTKVEKFTIDQFITNGGKTLWMLDNVQADLDSLLTTGKMLAYPIDLNLTDLLFSYGVRVNNTLIKDLYSSKIALATGTIGNQPQFQNLDWFYHPLVIGNTKHPITKNVLPVRFQFTTHLDTLKNNIKKTPLLVSSMLTQKIGTPNYIDLQEIAEEPIENNYNKGAQLLAVLLEGKFSSAYKNRIKPFNTELYKAESYDNKMVVIADGDIGKNQILKGKPFNLSRDKWTGQEFGNKNFLTNTVDYLLDDSGLLNLRNKALKIRVLNKHKTFKERSLWQIINVIAPLILLSLLSLFFSFLRKRKFKR